MNAESGIEGKVAAAHPALQQPAPHAAFLHPLEHGLAAAQVLQPPAPHDAFLHPVEHGLAAAQVLQHPAPHDAFLHAVLPAAQHPFLPAAPHPAWQHEPAVVVALSLLPAQE